MKLIDRGRQLTRWTFLQFGAAYFSIVAIGGSAAVVFLAIWPLSTIVVLALVVALTPVVTKIRRARSSRKTTIVEQHPPAQ